MIFLALPFIFVTFVIQFPAGLLVYWITTNLWTIVQQLIIKKRLGPMRPMTRGRARIRRQACSAACWRRRRIEPSPNGPKPVRFAARRRRRRWAAAEPKGRPSQAAAVGTT